MNKQFADTRFAQFFKNPGMHIANLWKHLPEGEKAVADTLDWVKKIQALAGSAQAQELLLLLPDGIGEKTITEVQALLPAALALLPIAQDGLKAAESITDPVQKANVLLTTVLTEAAKLPLLAKDAHILNLAAAIVAKALDVPFVQALQMVTTKENEIVAANTED